MARFIFPSSYLCDCSGELDFCENTIKAMKEMSLKKEIILSENDEDGYNHNIFFRNGNHCLIECSRTNKIYEIKNFE